MNHNKSFSLQSLLNEQESIDDLILKKFHTEDSYPALDGIVNEELYCKAPLKILWILKENAMTRMGTMYVK